MNFEHLRALSAIVDTGLFEAAADLLGVTPSAVSQRIKALEKSVGQVLVRRTLPSSPTDAGAVVLRMARQVQTLEADVMEDLGGGAANRGVVSVALNADSLATWFTPVLYEAAGWGDTELDLQVQDHDHSSHLLRQGVVVGAVTADPRPIGGCRAEPLGVIRYTPAASPDLLQRFDTDEGINWSKMPMLRFGPDDDMQHQLLRSRGVGQFPPMHTIPSSEGFLEAVHAGLGWGMLPQIQLQEDPRQGVLVSLEPQLHHDVLLYWQCWSLSSVRLERITHAVRHASSRLLQI
ncbi:LysR family transcriptional regulator ArgP [Arthrobacter sp. AB6]|uniref:LysR family transcriptional regulator ArgP n=1 Tax=Arthrobacter sp. AB6 TaxID=2962570 RepID=UPI002881D7CF|nr:LysR family transcriptional regulator ArgP [Arthrobacter sp. AB6]MDT0196503.1 LysR family transcriptional regulator ArgP [Arthrobacter sp. AB6]